MLGHVCTRTRSSGCGDIHTYARFTQSSLTFLTANIHCSLCPFSSVRDLNSFLSKYCFIYCRSVATEIMSCTHKDISHFSEITMKKTEAKCQEIHNFYQIISHPGLISSHIYQLFLAAACPSIFNSAVYSFAFSVSSHSSESPSFHTHVYFSPSTSPLLSLLPLHSPCHFYFNLYPRGMWLWLAAPNADLFEVQITARMVAICNCCILIWNTALLFFLLFFGYK